MFAQDQTLDALDIPGGWQAWILLRHLLPVRTQRVFVRHVVQVASGATLSLSDLFEELYTPGPVWADSWLLRPIDGATGDSAFLQRWVKAFVWESDESFDFRSPTQGDIVAFRAIQDLTQIAPLGLREVVPFLPSGDSLSSMQHSAVCGLSVLRIATAVVSSPNAERDASDAICDNLTDLPVALRAMMLKHLADLLADVDAWRAARRLYSVAADLLEAWSAPPSVRDIRDAWRSILAMSSTAAAAVVDAPSKQVDALTVRVRNTRLAASPILVANYGLEATSDFATHSGYWDGRVLRQSASLLHDAHDAHQAFQFWMSRNTQPAIRRFRGLLRRQVALGATLEARVTRGWYARCIIEHLVEKPESPGREALFARALSLFLESGDAKSVGWTNWSRELLDRNLESIGVVDNLIGQATRYDGDRNARLKALIAILRRFALVMADSHRDLASQILRRIAKLAKICTAAFSESEDTGRPALEAIKEIGEKNATLCDVAGDEIAEAIVTKLAEEFWLGRAAAAEAALPFAAHFATPQLRRIADALLNVLEQEDPSADAWPLVRPALRFLVDPEVRTRVGSDGGVDGRTLSQILRHDLAETSGRKLLFFHLADFDEHIVLDESIRERLAEVVKYLQNAATQISHSDVTTCIDALLVAPQFVGKSGASSALDGLNALLLADKKGASSIGLAGIDRPLLTIAVGFKKTGSVLPLLVEDLAQVSSNLEDLWRRAAVNPLLFRRFSLPPRTTPERVVVHNCAFASIRFAHALGRQAEMRAALEAAEKNPQLTGPIDLARTTHASGAAFAPDEVAPLRAGDRLTFYEALGRRLTQTHRLPLDAAKEVCRDLLDGIFRFGPDAADAGVLVRSVALGLARVPEPRVLKDYSARIRHAPEVRLLLLPLLDLLWEATQVVDEAQSR